MEFNKAKHYQPKKKRCFPPVNKTSKGIHVLDQLFRRKQCTSRPQWKQKIFHLILDAHHREKKEKTTRFIDICPDKQEGCKTDD